MAGLKLINQNFYPIKTDRNFTCHGGEWKIRAFSSKSVDIEKGMTERSKSNTKTNKQTKTTKTCKY